MKLESILAFCSLTSAAFIPHFKRAPPSVSITFTNEKSGRSFTVDVPADHESHTVITHGPPLSHHPVLVTSAQLTQAPSDMTTCVIESNGHELATLDTRHTFTWLLEKGRHHGSINLTQMTVNCVA